MLRVRVATAIAVFFSISITLFYCVSLHLSNERRVIFVEAADTLSAEEFAVEYISLQERVNLVKGKVSSGLHYSKSEKEGSGLKRGGIFFAVVTTEKYLKTRAAAIYETWATDVSGSNKLYFFVGEDCETSDPALRDMPIIKIAGIRDRVYPPQKKVFAVLRYVAEHFGKEFQWFVRADDDVYIRIKHLEEFLLRLDWTKRFYLGSPGMGKMEDRKRLKLLPHENYCMGGPGIVFSAAALHGLGRFLDKCLLGVKVYNQNQRDISQGWYNEDVELGRCISRTMGITCTDTRFWDGKFVQIYDMTTLNFSNLWTKPTFVNAITVHPVKNQDHLFHLHHFYKTQDYLALSVQLDKTAHQLTQLCSKLPVHFYEKNTNDIVDCVKHQKSD